MKRRNAEFGKLRRPMKRNKIAEGMYGSNTFLYVKYLILWAIVITADFMLDFRFEFLWPFWLLLRSVYDSFKYKGLAFTILFVCIAITSDLVCLFFIPVSWLFFLASTYVWVQYVWHADKGFCLPTIFLWMLFLYLEGAVRWRDDSKTIPHVDLCRPFAAHCIGYPVVTLGFGVKSYVGYRIRHRKQREVAKENDFYMQLLQLALPHDDSMHDELLGQMRHSEQQQQLAHHQQKLILHSDKLGDIDLPISSPILAQRIQQQQLLLAANSLNSNQSSSSNSNSSNNATMTNTAATSNATSNSNHHHHHHNSGTSNTMSTLAINNLLSSSSSNTSNMVASTSSTSTSSSSNQSAPIGASSTGTPFHHNCCGANLSSQQHNNNNRCSMDKSIMNVLKSHTFQHFFNDMDRSASGNSCGQHNGIGLHHNTSNAGQSLNASSSVLTYRSNRRSVDRSDNKSQNDMGSSQRHAANGVNHHAKGAASANDCNTNQLHKDRTNSNNTNSSSGHHHQHTTPTSGAYHSSILNGASRLSELIFTSIFSTIKYRLIGGPDCNEPNDINLVLNNHSTDRIDDDVPNECNDIISLNNAMGSGGAAVVAMSQSSTQTNSNSFTTITSSLSNGEIRTECPNHVQHPSGKEKSMCKQHDHPDGEQQVQQQQHTENHITNNSTENTERNRGRRNRGKQRDTQLIKDNHSNTSNNNSTTSTTSHPSNVPEIRENGSAVLVLKNNHYHNHQSSGNATTTQNHQASASANSNSSPSAFPSLLSATQAPALPNAVLSVSSSSSSSQHHQQPDHCESCNRLEVELKKVRAELSQLKQTENELRQKCDQNTTVKTCLQAKQKENDELEKKVQELTSARQLDRQTMQQTDRRLTEERRQKQSLEAQLNNERKQRKLTEEKLSRPECSEACKMRKQMLENECKQLRRDLSAIDELKKSAEQQSRNYEQELRKFEAELRSRESRESTEVLMSALQAMQDKNTTLEKNLSAETRVKLDLFSALGEAKRQLEIRDNVIRQKEKDVMDLKSKIAQLYAVMPSVPNESWSGCSLRLGDGPSSPLSHTQSDAVYTPKNDA